MICLLSRCRASVLLPSTPKTSCQCTMQQLVQQLLEYSILWCNMFAVISLLVLRTNGHHISYIKDVLALPNANTNKGLYATYVSFLTTYSGSVSAYNAMAHTINHNEPLQSLVKILWRQCCELVTMNHKKTLQKYMIRRSTWSHSSEIFKVLEHLQNPEAFEVLNAQKLKRYYLYQCTSECMKCNYMDYHNQGAWVLISQAYPKDGRVC